ncbi:MAG TPA: hypothetical protein VF291_00820 [Burkholderiaceae bacterium]|jgi:hypothetical protein
MLPRPLHPAPRLPEPGAPRAVGIATPNPARQFKVLQSSRAPAQRSLFGPLPPR